MSASERTGWRDAELSARHRIWGVDCPAVDLDFLMVEYNAGLPAAILEYKHFKAQEVQQLHPTYRALTALADKAELPFLIVRYWPGIWAFRVQPINELARKIYGDGMDLTEHRFVASLYHIRGLVIKEQVLKRLNTEYPPKA